MENLGHSVFDIQSKNRKELSDTMSLLYTSLFSLAEFMTCKLKINSFLNDSRVPNEGSKED